MTTQTYHTDTGEARRQMGQDASNNVITDPATKARLALFDAQPLQNVIDMLADVKVKIAAMRQDEALLEAYVESRMIAENATIAHHPDFEKIALEPQVTNDVNADLLYVALDDLVTDGIISEEAARKATWIERIPAQRVTKTHLSRINDLRKYGDKVTVVIDKYVRRIEGPPRLKMVPKKKK